MTSANSNSAPIACFTGGPTLDVAHELVMPIISNDACERTFDRGMRWTTRLCAGHNNTMQGICRASGLFH